LIKIYFKDVGQGDSIVLEWEKDGSQKIGIIDCHINNGTNPTLDHLKRLNPIEIEFIILTHFHYDHFSGMADIFDHCIKSNIKIKYFYHSIAAFVLEIYNRVLTTQKVSKAIKEFFDKYEGVDDNITNDKIQISKHIQNIELNNTTSLKFLAPAGRVYEKMDKQIARKIARVKNTYSDVNKLACIMLIENAKQNVLLTSDAVKSNYKKLKLTTESVLVQAPHHGSWQNIIEPFWKGINKINDCPCVFSVGDEPKDKLPNEETVRMFDTFQFKIYSTNPTYGIDSFFKLNNPISPAGNKGSIINIFSKPRKNARVNSSQYSGEQIFSVL